MPVYQYGDHGNFELPRYPQWDGLHDPGFWEVRVAGSTGVSSAGKNSDSSDANGWSVVWTGNGYTPSNYDPVSIYVDLEIPTDCCPIYGCAPAMWRLSRDGISSICYYGPPSGISLDNSICYNWPPIYDDPPPCT